LPVCAGWPASTGGWRGRGRGWPRRPCRRGCPALARARELLARERRLVETRGAAAAAELVAVRRELSALEDEADRRPPLDDAAFEALLADLAGRVERLAAAERQAAEALRAAVP
jgi:hypothetical protein